MSDATDNSAPHVVIQFSHPADDSDDARALRADGLTPLVINGTYLASTYDDHLQEALDHAARRARTESDADRLAHRASVVDAMTAEMARDPEHVAVDDHRPATLADDALLLLAEGLVQHGYDTAESLPYCAIRFTRDALDAPRLEKRGARS